MIHWTKELSAYSQSVILRIEWLRLVIFLYYNERGVRRTVCGSEEYSGIGTGDTSDE